MTTDFEPGDHVDVEIGARTITATIEAVRTVHDCLRWEHEYLVAGLWIPAAQLA